MNNRKFGFIGSYIPRQCGLATFTADALRAVASTGAQAEAIVVEDKAGEYRYPSEVRRTFRQHDRRDYEEVARWINGRRYDCLCIQHEYGIYGGEAGSYLLDLVARVHCPIVTTLHTILENPNPRQKSVLERLIRLSDRVICMSETGKRILKRVYGASEEKIQVIAHGIPPVLVREPCAAKKRLEWNEENSLFTFGLLSPDKGVDDMIRALPKIVEKFPDTVYTVCGVTHPHIRAKHGETLRESLIELAQSLGVENNVRFENQFVGIEDLTTRLQACDIYVTPYRNMNQITSGTLAYAFGCGNAVVSTPYWHASELLAEGRGELVPVSNSDALADSIIELLGNDVRRHQLQAQAFELGKEMHWPRTGELYVSTFDSVRSPQIVSLIPSVPLQVENEGAIGVDYLLSLVDDVGTIQHATYGIPNRMEGYCVDDCARTALVLARIPEPNRETEAALRRNLSFLDHAVDSEQGICHNFMSYDRRWLESGRSDDAVGRAIWALGCVIASSWGEDFSPHHDFAKNLLRRAMPLLQDMTYIRGKATTTTGLALSLRGGAEGVAWPLEKTARELHDTWRQNASADWPWFEHILAYDNAHLPHSLIAAGSALNDDQMIADGLIALDWLCAMQTSIGGIFRPIGSDGFYPREGERALFDQQPLEVWTTLEAIAEAYRATGDRRWLSEAEMVFGWFDGGNDLEISMVDASTGGAYDGLTPCGPNRNQGAESAISLVGSAQVAAEMRAAKEAMSDLEEIPRQAWQP